MTRHVGYVPAQLDFVPCRVNAIKDDGIGLLHGARRNKLAERLPASFPIQRWFYRI